MRFLAVWIPLYLFSANLELGSPLQDHMVLQRDSPLPIWGRGNPNTEVAIQLAGHFLKTQVDEEGHWRIIAPSLSATNHPIHMIVESGNDRIWITDILVGEVWVASGQSNMACPLQATPNAWREIALADFSKIRFLNVPLQVAQAPQNRMNAIWQVCHPKVAANFSAVAYFFAQHLHKNLSVPIGIINVSWPGSPMEAWTSLDALKTSDTFQKAIESAERVYATPEEAAVFQATSLFNGMIAPLIPFSIRGVIWYQGESNVARHNQYLELSKCMIRDWRKRWGQGDFPFLFAQLSEWESGGKALSLLRDAQEKTLQEPNTGMIVTLDLSHPNDCHPVNKQEIGKRFGLLAERVEYHKTATPLGQ